MEASSKGRSKARRPDLDTVYTINADGSRNFLHPADVRGPWQRRKHVVWAALIAIYIALPWIPVGGHPAIHVDLRSRSAHLFGSTFTNQDFYLVFFLVSGLGFALFVVTSLWGRIWCGYACPQSVFMEGVFRKIERMIEGPRDERVRRNLGPWTWDKAGRKTIKLAIFLALSFAIAHIFLAYFIPVRELLGLMTRPPGSHSGDFFWVMAWTGVLFFDFAWFREQTCLIICPYGRAQSALVDRDTVIIGYDATRGEPRGRKGETTGDCIDCFRCVAVCPTGIDIRNGLQMECIGCANCVDACDEVMERVGRAPGLVRYDSQRGFAGEPRRSLRRPRVVLYAFLGVLGLAVFGFSALGRSSFEVHALRARGLPYQIDGDAVRNVFTIRIQNKGSTDATYVLSEVPGESPVRPALVIAQSTVRLAPLADHEVPIIATVPRADASSGAPMRIAVTDSATGETSFVDVAFRGP
jgi:cytochrome c oxidase accessory protein FixG